MKTASAVVPLANPAFVLDTLCTHMASHELAVEFDGRVASTRLPVGRATMRLEPASLALEVEAETESGMEGIIGFLASHVLEFAHPERPAIRWSGFEPSRALADFREMKVVAVADITPHMRRITLTGSDLGRFATEDNLHVRLFFPPRGRPPVWPTRGADGVIEPVEPALRPAVRKYTIRRIDAAKGLVDIDFLLHEDAGPGSDWARGAGEGDLLGMAGPGGRGAKPADWLLLAGDETALPAIARILEGLPPRAEGIALIEVEGEADELALSRPAGFELRWLHRAAGTGLAAAVARVAVPKDRTHFCWAGAEFAEIQAIRRHWVEECGVARPDQLAVSYWRKGEPEAS